MLRIQPPFQDVEQVEEVKEVVTSEPQEQVKELVVFEEPVSDAEESKASVQDEQAVSQSQQEPSTNTTTTDIRQDEEQVESKSVKQAPVEPAVLRSPKVVMQSPPK